MIVSDIAIVSDEKRFRPLRRGSGSEVRTVRASGCDTMFAPGAVGKMCDIVRANLRSRRDARFRKRLSILYNNIFIDVNYVAVTVFFKVLMVSLNVRVSNSLPRFLSVFARSFIR